MSICAKMGKKNPKIEESEANNRKYKRFILGVLEIYYLSSAVIIRLI